MCKRFGSSLSLGFTSQAHNGAELKEFYSTWLDVIDVIVILWHSCQILHVPMSAYLVGDLFFYILRLICDIGLESNKLCETLTVVKTIQLCRMYDFVEVMHNLHLFFR